MAFWTGWLGKIGDVFAGSATGTTGVVLSKSDGSPDLWQSANDGAAKVDIPSALSVASSALEASHVVSSSSSNLRAVSCRLDATAPTGTYYVHVLDAATVPVNGVVTHLLAPEKVQHINGVDDLIDLPIPLVGIAASVGVVVCLSSTEFAKTLSGAYLSITGVVS